jgi:acetyl-CoA acyltransferase
MRPSSWQAASSTALLVEVRPGNQAFAAQTLAVIKLLKANPDRSIVRGGAIAIGHPLGAAGARLSATLLPAMQDHKAPLGLATMCISAGREIATISEAA